MRPAIKFSIAVLAILLCFAPGALGQLETRATFPVLYAPYLVAAGDFNHDGAQDVAVTCFEAGCGGGIQVLLGRGDGTFASAVALRILGEAGSAEDVLQEVFIGLWRSPGIFDSTRGNLGAWL
ncbi:MAG: hypothetical protein H0X25_19240, partial [Acidobacteriales bacterium]|nr:hypothetical protein [Terriglobales bacterium]